MWVLDLSNISYQFETVENTCNGKKHCTPLTLLKLHTYIEFNISLKEKCLHKFYFIILNILYYSLIH